jgi:hypothetical protein
LRGSPPDEIHSRGLSLLTALLARPLYDLLDPLTGSIMENEMNRGMELLHEGVHQESDEIPRLVRLTCYYFGGETALCQAE